MDNCCTKCSEGNQMEQFDQTYVKVGALHLGIKSFPFFSCNKLDP